MKYTMMDNDPFTRNRITHSYVWWNDGFSNEELDRLEKFCDTVDLVTAITTDLKDDVRKSKVKFYNRTNEAAWIFDRFNMIASTMNDKFYGFDLYGYDNFQYTVYESGDRYDWHMDTVMGNELNGMEASSTRKFSLVMLLNEPKKDFTGGEFELNLSSENDAKNVELKRGMIVAFPSFMIHRVKPVLSGIRKSIVIWIQGPKFR